MVEKTSWKQVGDVIKTEGNILEIGSFISHSGNKVDISPEQSTLLFNNIDASLDFVIDHKDGFQEKVGSAIKFAPAENGIEHQGFVYNNSAVQSAIAMGYNSISPVIDFDYDETGKVVNGKIVKLALVQNPAMKQNKVNMTRFAFSAPEVNSMTTVSQPTQSEATVTVQGQSIPAATFTETAPATPPAFDPQEFAKNIASSIVEGFSQKIGGQLEAMQKEIADMKAGSPSMTAEPIAPEIKENLATLQPVTSQEPTTVPPEMLEQIAKMQAKLQDYENKIEKEEKAVYTAKLAELRSLGQENPEKLVASIKDTRTKIETLDALKAAIIKNTPMNSPQTVPLGTEGGKNQSIKQPTVLGLADSLKIKLDDATLERASKSLRIPIQ